MAAVSRDTSFPAFPLVHSLESLEFAAQAFRDLAVEAGVEAEASGLLAIVYRARRHVLEATEIRLRPSTYALTSFEAAFRGAEADFKMGLKVSPSAKVREWQVLRGLAVVEEAFALLRIAVVEQGQARSRA